MNLYLRWLPWLCIASLHAEPVAPAPTAGPAKPEPVAPVPAAAPAKPEPGHSLHGEAFNEGPRQAAVLMSGTGDLHFPITTSNEQAQKFFVQGVGQLHGFWYFEAERSFRQAAALDADCAMAYWGMAMANINNAKRATEFIKKAEARKEKMSRREQLWIGSLAAYYTGEKKDEKERRDALVKALEELSFEFPEDLEAKAFLVFHIWDNKQHGIPIPSRQAVDALAQQVLTGNPMHPGAHHYLIHLWNYGAGDKRALPSAARCGQSAPAIAHMWHMPGHTFSAQRRYADAAWQQEAAARVDHAYTMAARVLPDQIHNFAHNNDWLAKSLALVGRVHDAVDLAKNMIELPRPGAGRSPSYKFGRERLLDLLMRFELWNELTSLDGTMYLGAFDDPIEEVKRRRALGVAWIAKGERERGEAQLATLKTMAEKTRTERFEAADRAEAKAKKEKKPDDQIAKAMADAMRGFAYRIDQTEAAISELRLMSALAEGKVEAAKKELETLKDIPSIRLAGIHFQLGDKAKALSLAREAADADDKQVATLANLADLQWRCGEKENALATFKKLRELSSQLDLDLPIFARLAPLAQELQLHSDWRVTSGSTADSGIRPDLAQLGPFRWRPSPAPGWALFDSKGQAHGLEQHAGRPVLVVFYLGSGCTHCIEQLNVFAPVAKSFAEAGIDLVAVSTDSPDVLHQTLDKAKDAAGFPFPILSDSTLATFKAYRAFDDFEQMPLHGAFLIDAAGLVRWQDIGFQPFREATWLLGEAKRLLAIPASRNTAAR